MRIPTTLSICLLLFAGCGVRGMHTDFVRYDAKDDSFVHLHSWTNIYCAKWRDVDHVQSLWARRESIMISPVGFLAVPAIERRGGHSYRWIDLDSDSSNPVKVDNTIDFDTIQIIPGELYEDVHGRLAYSHTEVIPGGTMDAIVTASVRALAAAIAEEQLTPSGKLKNRKATWDEFRESAAHALDLMAGVADSPKPKNNDGTLPFDVTSLKMLAKASAEGGIKVSRVRDQFVIVVPLSPEDSVESVTTFIAYQKKLAQLVKDGRPMAELAEGANAITMKAVDEAGLEMTIQFSKIAVAWNKASKARLEAPAKPSVDADSKYQSTVTSLKERGVPIAPMVSLETVLKDYME